jgi:hypothetical protein
MGVKVVGVLILLLLLVEVFFDLVAVSMLS